MNSLVIWSADALRGIEDGTKRSCRPVIATRRYCALAGTDAPLPE
jgi:hypothetical protein